MESSEGPRPPRQERSRRTLRNLERAALDLVARDGADAVTVAAVVARARSSVGSFYARFAGKDELFRHLEARLWEEALDRWRGSGIAAPGRAHEASEVLKETVALLVHLEEVDGALRRSLGAGGAPSEAQGRFLAGLTGDLAAHLGVTGSQGDGRVQLGLRIVLAVLSALCPGVDGRAGDGGSALTASGLESDLTRILATVLAVEGIAPEEVPEALESQPSKEGSSLDQKQSPDPDVEAVEAVDPFDVWG